MKKVQLVEIGGEKNIYGLNGLTNGPINDSTRQVALKHAAEQGF
ncbi:MAG: hypothetical protein ACRD4Y_09330 [Candidatus Acidiferrales bacterium]